jgi:prepilin-type N-terminal cleavage/methylation domain-containing protein
MKSVSTRRGFTLVELLTVIAIIAILTVILLPAVGAARRTAQLHSCQNNVKQLTTATINYETTWNRYPGYNEQLKGGGQIFAWPIALMPNLDRTDIYDRVRQWALKSANQDLPADILVYESAFVCPVDTGLAAYKGAQFSKQDGPGISYAVNAGRADREFRPDGVFFNYPAAKLVCSLENIRDGASKTLLLSENLSATSWAALSGKQTPLAPESIFVWHNKIPSTAAEVVLRINGGVLGSPPPLSMESARPSSFHPAGVVAGFADGHVTLLTIDTPYQVYAQLMSSDSAAQKNTIPELAGYVLRDSDF